MSACSSVVVNGQLQCVRSKIKFHSRQWYIYCESHCHTVFGTGCISGLPRIVYKLSTIVYKCIHGAAPFYLMNLCVPVATNTSRRYLRSATHGDLLVLRTKTVAYGPRSFAVSGPTVWNTLPSTLRVSTTTLGQFQSGLKTILFRLAYGT